MWHVQLLLSNTQEIVAAMCELVSPDDDEVRYTYIN